VEAKHNEEPKMFIKALCVEDANPMFERYNCERNASGLRDRFELAEPGKRGQISVDQNLRIRTTNIQKNV
jgi:hypothetical protein